jgi:tetratricopeptide (TPR) repeat protein
MATDSARSTTPPAARHLWQVPALILGVAAVIAVLTVRPNSSANTASAAEHQLRDARRALDQSPPAAAAALQRVDSVLAMADHYPQLAGEAHFLAGSAHLRLADDPAADAARERQLAQQHLDQAAALHVSDADQPKLNYRLAKISLLLGGDPAKVVALLEKSADADDPAEGYGLLALAYTRQTPPDLAKALEASKQQLDRALRSNDAKLQASARFRLGSLNLQLKKNVKEGRLMLSKVGTEAEPDEFYKARVLLAESYEETPPPDWDSAARNWEQARQNPKLTPAEKAKTVYHLGLCAFRAQRKEAADVFVEAISLGGPEGQAAGLRLAELKLDADPAAAVAAMVAALQTVHGPDDYSNPLVPIEDIRQDVEKAVRSARDKGDWDLARTAVEVYSRVAIAGKDDELAGQVFDAQAQSLVEGAKADAANQATITEQANEAFRQAAVAYERASGKVPAGPDQATWLWRSAQLFLRAGQIPRALELLSRVTQLNSMYSSDSMAEAWYLIATASQTGARLGDARTAFEKCLAIPGPFALKARLGLAEIDVAESRFDDAERILQEVLKDARELPQPDTGLQELATYDAARLAYLRQGGVKEELRDYTTAEQRLLGAIEQYPNSLQAPAARLLLGLAYWTDARLKDQALRTPGLSPDEKRTYDQRRTELLMKSAENYDRAEQLLLARQRNGLLTAKDAQCLKQAAFWGSDCYFWAHRYDESIRRSGTLALRYKGTPEELIALTQLYSSYANDGQVEKAMGVLKRLAETVENMPATAFDGSLSTHKREYWVKLLAEINKPAIPPASPAPPRAPAGK